MPKIPSNEQFLSDLLAHVHEKTNKKLAQTAISPGGDVIPSELPQPMQDWLGQLALLYGVPFNNLVSNESLFPTESIRFFYLDENWINSLLDGALSIGANNSKDIILQLGVQGNIRTGSRLSRQLVRSKILNGASPTEATVDITVTGIVIRSEVVSGWPGLEIMGYSDTEGTNELDILRMDRLAPDIMLCLFNGTIEQLIIAEPKEGLRFGVLVDAWNKPYSVQPRYLGGDADQPTGKPVTQSSPPNFAVPQFRNNSRKVLDIDGTINGNGGIVPTLKNLNVELPATGFEAAAFGVEMIYTAEQAIFTLNKGKLLPASVGCPPDEDQ